MNPKDYPLLYQGKDFYFECGAGWHPLIQRLSQKLEAIIQRLKDEDCEFIPYAVQVKEKYGTLRFYMNIATDEMYELIDAAEKEGEHICEDCSAPGKLRPGAWYKVNCDACYTRRTVRKEDAHDEGKDR